MTDRTISSDAVFEKSFHVRAYEIDFNARLQPLAILNYLQDTAGDHAYQLGVSISHITDLGLTWVISHYDLHIYNLPHYGELLTVRTWPSFREDKETYRDFELLDSHGNRVASASTSWRLLETDRMRPVRVADHLPPYPVHPHRTITTDFPSLGLLPSVAMELPFRVRMSDMDINHHVNNAIYAAWALETVPEELLRSALPERIVIHFRAPAFYGDRILSRSCPASSDTKSIHLHSLIRESDGCEVARLRSHWTSRQ